MTGWVRVGNVDVDVDALLRLAHACDPMKCRHTQSCCRSYEVPVERNETERIAGCVLDAARFADGLLDGGSPIDPFDETEGGMCLNTDEQGECVFAYRAQGGAVYCSLHTLALEWGLPPATVKPKACSLWPLAIHGGEPMQLSTQENAYQYPCNTRRRAGVRTLHPGVAAIIESVFGIEFLTQLTHSIEKVHINKS